MNAKAKKVEYVSVENVAYMPCRSEEMLLHCINAVPTHLRNLILTYGFEVVAAEMIYIMNEHKKAIECKK